MHIYLLGYLICLVMVVTNSAISNKRLIIRQVIYGAAFSFTSWAGVCFLSYFFIVDIVKGKFGDIVLWSAPTKKEEKKK